MTSRYIIAIIWALSAILCNSFLVTKYNRFSRVTEPASSLTNAEENPRLNGLALQLDDGTRKSHSLAENTAFVSGFFKGLSTRVAYRALLTSLYFVYLEMEKAFDTTEEETVKSIDYPELRRVKALEQDMDFFYGDEWKSKIKPSLATETYVSRIQEISIKSPHLLIAHQYSRYLGDLFGGQMMSGMATRSLRLEKDKGVEFYQFEEIGSVKLFIDIWYSELNDLDLTPQQKQEIVDEANYVFALNIGIFEELNGSPVKAIWTIAVSSLKQKFGLAS